MKKIFQFLGVITLLLGSFLYKEKVIQTSKTTDSLLNEIQMKKDNYTVKSIEPIITKNTIISGISGKKVNVKASYDKMKQVGYFDESQLVYTKTLPKNTLSQNKDKFIIGANASKKEIALIFKVKNSDNINNIVNSFSKERVTFFITGYYLENNYTQVLSLLKNGHTIGNLSDNENYNNSSFAWIKTIISAKGQKNNYCFADKWNKKVLNLCKINSSYTIMPTIIKSYPLIKTKRVLKNGALISYEINNSLNQKIKSIISYVKNKGYKIKSLDEILKE